MQPYDLSSSSFIETILGCCHLLSHAQGTPADDWVSMGVFSDGSYSTPKVKRPHWLPNDLLETQGVMFSFPVTCSGGKWKIVQVCFDHHKNNNKKQGSQNSMSCWISSLWGLKKILFTNPLPWHSLATPHILNVQGLSMSPFAMGKLAETGKELCEEREEALAVCNA